MISSEFKKKTFLVVGGSRGIGYNIKTVLQDSGHTVYSISRHPEKMADATKNKYWLKYDLLNTDSVVKIIEYFVQKKIQLDGVVYSGQMRVDTGQHFTHASDYLDHMAVNVVVPAMLQRLLTNFEVAAENMVAVILLDSRTYGLEYAPYISSQLARSRMTPLMRRLSGPSNTVESIAIDALDPIRYDEELCKTVENLLTGLVVNPSGHTLVI